MQYAIKKEAEATTGNQKNGCENGRKAFIYGGFGNRYIGFDVSLHMKYL